MIDFTDLPTAIDDSTPSEVLEALFREAKRRERRRHLKWLLGVVTVLTALSLLLSAGMGAFATKPHGSRSASSAPVATRASVAVLTCSGKPATRPSTFLISCADGNAEIYSTKWTTWSPVGASGTGRFALNLCNPYCAASPISIFPNSTISLLAPRHTEHGMFFSKLAVTYRLHGKKQTFAFTWTGSPAFVG